MSLDMDVINLKDIQIDELKRELKSNNIKIR
jgi:hypothetical protein